jgi:hypothetical protein
LSLLAILQLPYHTSGPSCINQDQQVEQLCKLTSLEHLTVELDATISQASLKHITKLKGLSSLVLNGVGSQALLAKLGQLKKLRRLSVSAAVSALSGWPELEALEHVEQLDLG